MDCGHSNETQWPNSTLLTYTLPADGKVRESVNVPLKKAMLYLAKLVPENRPSYLR